MFVRAYTCRSQVPAGLSQTDDNNTPKETSQQGEIKNVCEAFNCVHVGPWYEADNNNRICSVYSAHTPQESIFFFVQLFARTQIHCAKPIFHSLGPPPPTAVGPFPCHTQSHNHFFVSSHKHTPTPYPHM